METNQDAYDFTNSEKNTILLQHKDAFDVIKIHDDVCILEYAEGPISFLSISNDSCSIRYHSYTKIDTDLCLVKDFDSKQVLIKLPDLTKSLPIHFDSYSKINDDLYLLKSGHMQNLVNTSKMITTGWIVSYEIINYTLFLVNINNVDKSLLNVLKMKISKSFKSYEIINQDLYILNLTEHWNKKVIYRLSDNCESALLEFDSYQKINKDLYLLNDDKGRHNNIFSLLTMTVSDDYEFVSCTKISKFLYLLENSHGQQAFFNIEKMEKCEWFVSKEKINKHTYIIEFAYSRKISLIRTTDMKTSDRCDISSYQPITDSICVLRNPNDQMSFFNLKDMTKSLWYSLSSFKVVGKKIILISKSGSEACLNTDTMDIGPWQFPD